MHLIITSKYITFKTNMLKKSLVKKQISVRILLEAYTKLKLISNHINKTISSKVFISC